MAETRFDPDAQLYYVAQEDGTWKVVPATAYETGPVDAALIGAGKVLQQGYEGIKDIFASDEESAALQAKRAEENRLYAPLQQAQPAASMIGQALPYLATAPLGGGVLAQAGIAGGIGMATTPGDIGSRAAAGGESALWGGGGAMAANLVGRAFNGVRGVYDDAMAARFRQLGGKVTPGQATGSAGLRRMESTMGAAGGMDQIKAANLEMIGGKVKQALGTSADDLSPAGLGQAADEIGARFDEALNIGSDIKLPETVVENIRKLGGDNPFLELPSTLDNLASRDFAKMRSQISSIARSEARSSSSNALRLDAALKTVRQMDDAFEDVAGPANKAAYRQAREQWRNLLAVERGQALSSEGIANPRSMKAAINQVWGKTARRAQYDRVLPETAELMETIDLAASKGLQDIVGDSGTASRLLWGLGPGGAAAGITGLSGGDTQDVLTSLMLGLAGSGAMRAYMGSGGLMAGQAVPGMAGGGRALLQGLMAPDEQ